MMVMAANRLREILDVRELAVFGGVGKVGSKLVELVGRSSVAIRLGCLRRACRLVAICPVTCWYLAGSVCCSCWSVFSNWAKGDSRELSDDWTSDDESTALEPVLVWLVEPTPWNALPIIDCK